MSMALKLISALLIVSVTACTQVATYPPLPGSIGASPSMQPMPQVMVTSLMSMRHRSLIDGEFVFNLPEGLSSSMWKYVQKKLAPDARPLGMEDLVDRTPVFSIRQIRIRGRKAEVDIVSRLDREWKLSTVHLSAEGIGPFHVDFIQPWAIQVDPPVPNDPSIAAPAGGSTDEVSAEEEATGQEPVWEDERP